VSANTTPAVGPYGVLSFLLQYPDAGMLGERDALDAAVAAIEARSVREPIQAFLADWSDRPLDELCAHYVETFDFDRRASLHLTFHLFGDRRDRGSALARLKRRYSDAGLPMGDRELPDYLPAMLEFAELAEADSGVATLNEMREPIELVHARLVDSGSPYAHLLKALRAGLPRLTSDQEEEIRRLALEGPPSEEVGLEPFGAEETMPHLVNGAAS